ncbi:LOW QUALITY PROTEIN: F-box/WD repeat-containing protein 12 [Theristicus caerulescens]
MLSKGHGIFPGVLSSTSLNALLNRAGRESNLLALFNDVLFSNFYFTVGKTVVMAYLSDNEQFGAGKLRSLACTSSTDGTVTAWNGQEVRKYMTSHIFLLPDMVKLLTGQAITVLQHRLAVIACQVIPAWQGDSGEQLAAFSTSPPSCSLATHSVNNKPFLVVSRLKKNANKCPASPSEARQCLLVVFSLTEEAQQVSVFTLPGRFQSTSSCMEGHRTEIILLGHGSALKLYSIFGALLECFQDHHDTSTSIWVDSCCVVTSSLDPSLNIHVKKSKQILPFAEQTPFLLDGAHR